MTYQDANEELAKLGYTPVTWGSAKGPHKVEINGTEYLAVMFFKTKRPPVFLVSPQGLPDLALDFLLHNKRAVDTAKAQEFIEEVCP